jgi:hypothetical protein
MTIFDKLKSIVRSNDWDDESKALAKEWQAQLQESVEIASLVKHPGFSVILEQMKSDFKSRMRTVVSEDPELRAIRNMFIRTVGAKGTEDAVNSMLDEFLDEPIVLSTKKQ